MEYYLDRLFIQVLNMSITAGFCIAAILLIRLLLRRTPRRYLYVLWLVAAFRLVCPVSVGTEFSLFNLEEFSQSVPAAGTGSMEYISVGREETGTEETEQIRIRSGLAADTPVNERLFGASDTAFVKISLKDLLYVGGKYRYLMFTALSVGKYVWMTGIFVLLLYFSAGLWRMKRKVRMAVKAGPGEWEYESFGIRLGDVRAEIYECDGLTSPFVMGVLRPRIYLPCCLNGQPRNMILLHERYHIYRKDHLVKLFSFCLLSIYWFHPLVWAAWFCMCRDMEMSCDEKVLELLGEDQKKAYCRTLLDFAAGRRSGSRMPLAFGEHDVKRRIEHGLRFKKPVLWTAAAAAVAIAAAVIILGTNGTGNTERRAENVKEQSGETAQLLYEAKNPYVGDAPADGRLLQAIASVRPDSVFAGLSYKTELQTSAEPYEFHFLLEENGESLTVDETDAPKLDAEMQTISVLMLALIDNLGEVQWFYTVETPEGIINDMVSYCDARQAADLCGVSDIKSYGDSPEKVGELLDILKERGQDLGADSDDREEFEQWYASLPYELYEQAVPYEETEGSYTAYYDRDEDFMTVLARTPDRAVTVYGCYSRKYGARGLTVDYRIGGEGDSNHNYMDVVWDADGPGLQAAVADYDGDGRDEIALILVSGRGVGSYKERLIVFETYDTGTLEPYEFTYDQTASQLDMMVSTAIDTENDLIQILDGTSPESSVPLLSIPYDDNEGLNRVLAVELLSWYQFRAEDELALCLEPGVLMKGWPRVRYLPQENGDDSVLMFHIQYDPSRGPGGGYFTLTL